VNTVPALARFTIDRRLVPGEKVRDAIAEVNAAIKAAEKKIKGLKVETKTFLRIDPCMKDPRHALPAAFAQSVQRITGKVPKFSITTGFTDMHFFAVDGKLPSVGYGTGGRNVHGIDEAVKLSELLNTSRVYADFISRFEG
jgi:succinyl-diaminopimelate desuccinylase